MEEFLFTSAGICLVLALIAILPMLTTKRRWLAAVFFLISVGCFADCIYRVETHNRTTPENLESKIRQWLDAFHITSGKVQDDHAFFNYSAAAPNTPPLTVAREKDHPQYLTMAVTLTLSANDKETYDKLSAAQRTEFKMLLGAELAKAKIATIGEFSQGFSLTVLKRIPITSELNESTFYDTVSEVDFGFIIANNTIELFLARFKPTPPPSPTPSKEASRP